MTKTDGRILKNLYSDYFKLGVACEKINGPFTNHEIGNPDKEELMLEQFNSMTFGNELKPAYNMGCTAEDTTETYLPFVINPQAKAMLDWARDNGMSVRGHVMVWHSQCPREVFCKGYTPVTIPTDPERLKENPRLKFFEKLDPVCFVDRETLLARMKSYITSLTEYMYANDYMRTIYAWDVVNEAIELMDKTPTGLRNSYWYQIVGDDFIYWAFRFAYDAVETMSRKYAAVYGVNADDAEQLKSIKPILFYNDYNEFEPAKKAAIIAMLNREGNGHGSILGEKLIGGIGMQGHISDNNDIDEYMAALKEYSALDIEHIHITELDVKCTATGVNREYYQAVFYKKYFEALVEARKAGAKLSCVTFWGLTDDNSWIRGADPLLFRRDLSTKRAFDALCYALSGEDLGEPEPVVINLSDRLYDFEGEETAEQLGFTMKGFGNFTIQDKIVHSGKKAIANEPRFGDWSGVAFDVTDFIGQTVRVSAWVKSPAPAVILKPDAGEHPVIGRVETPDDEWYQLVCEYKVPLGEHSMQLQFGTEELKPDVFSPIYVDDVKVELIGLKESFEDKENIAAIRGAGHLPVLIVTDKDSVDGSSHSLLVVRQEKDATVKLNVSSYIGNRIVFKAFVKTRDSLIKVGLDGAEPVEYACVPAGDDWTEVSAEIDLTGDRQAAEIYVETDGNADYFIDDVFVSMKK